MSALLFSSILLGFVSNVAAQCTTSDNVNCVTWIKAGFCGNMAYTLAQRQAACGISCGLCTSAGVAIVSGVCSGDANANCATWAANGFCNNAAYTAAQKQAYCCSTCAPAATTTVATATAENKNCAKWFADPNNAYCASTTVTLAQKTLFCPTTCAFEVKPNADCALYTVTGTALARGTPSNRTTTPDFVASGAVAGTTTLSRAFAATGCTLSIFTDAAPAAGTAALEAFGPGTAATSFFTVTAANNAALSYTCTCV